VGGLLRVLVLAALATTAAAADERKNYYDDPFVQVTSGLAACPVPEAPLMTEVEARAQFHVRSERGLRCYLEGRCRLSSSYMYDKDIIARVQKAVTVNGGFKDTSVWALGQRRWVFLKGCVSSKAQSKALEQLVGSIDEVERVVNELSISPTTRDR
jgi:hypothetical protein